MITILRRHPFAILGYVIFLGVWGFFILGWIRIQTMQVEEGQAFCMTGPVLSYIMLQALSLLYLIGNVGMAYFGKERRFFRKLAILIVAPLSLLLIWSLVW